MPLIKRKEIRKLLPNDLLALRRALILFQKRNATDTDNYTLLAGYHGTPLWKCNHTYTGFLAWHRMYIWLFENELRKIDSTVSLPYWDWTDKQHFNDCLAPAHNDSQFVDEDVKPNPLFSAPIEDGSRQTYRNPVFSLQRLTAHARGVDIAIGTSKTFTELNRKLKSPHDGIHSNTGGDMGTMLRAAYDPIFWSHHATVDRQWAIWQKLNPTIPIAADILETDLNGFVGKKIKDVIEFENVLGYTYDDLLPGMNKYKDAAKYVRNLIILMITEVAVEAESYIVDVFLTDRQKERQVFASSFGIFGMGAMMHKHTHHMHHSEKSNYFLDITEAFNSLNTASQNIDVELHAIDEKGNTVDQNQLKIGGVRIIQDEYTIKNIF